MLASPLVTTHVYSTAARMDEVDACKPSASGKTMCSALGQGCVVVLAPKKQTAMYNNLCFEF